MNPTPQSPEPTVLPRGQSALPLGAARYSAVKLLVALGLLFVSAPFVQDLPHGDLVESVLLTLVMVSAVRVVGSRRKVLILALVLLTPALAGKWINHFRPDLLHPAIFLAAAVAFFAFVITRLLAFIVRAPRVDANVLCAGGGVLDAGFAVGAGLRRRRPLESPRVHTACGSGCAGP